MPFQSKAQRAYMHINHPKIAKKWEAEGNTPKHLPMHKSKVKSAARKAIGGLYQT